MTEYQDSHFSKELKESDLYILTEFFKVLGNPARIRILLLLMEQDSCVGDLAEQSLQGQTSMQLMELGIPMVLALNMMDEVRANGGSVRVNELEEILGIPVVPISAAKNEGTTELIDHALHAARHRESPGRVDFCPASNNEHDSVGAALSGLMGMGIDVLRRLQL